MKAYIYSVCTHCEHPNIHVENGLLCEHVISLNSPTKCLGSGMTASEARSEPLNRHTREFQVALEMAKAKTFNQEQAEPMRRPAFKTWMFSGLQFIAVPHDSNSDHIMDALGGNYGSWMSVEEFRKRQQAGILSEWQSLGRAHLQVVCER